VELFTVISTEEKYHFHQSSRNNPTTQDTVTKKSKNEVFISRQKQKRSLQIRAAVITDRPKRKNNAEGKINKIQVVLHSYDFQMRVCMFPLKHSLV
jgi:hypothetical protein